MSLGINLKSTDMAKLNRELNRLAEQTGKTLKDVLPAQMRLLAADLAYVTYPKGKGSQDNADHIKKIRSRIAAIYPPVGFVVNLLKKENEGAAGKFAELVTKRQYTKAQAITDKYLPSWNLTVGAFDGGESHRTQSDQKTITKRICVPGYTRVTAYANSIARKSGFAKGGFATAARQLGGVRGIPGWATRQKSPGTGKAMGDGVKMSVEMVNSVDYLRQAMKPNDEAAAVANRARQVGLVLRRIQDRKVKQIMKNFQ